MLLIDTKERQDAVERILGTECNWFPDLPCDGVHIDDFITFDIMAEIVDYLRGKNNENKR